MSDLEDATERAIAAAHWLAPSDAAVSSLAKHYARSIEDAAASGDEAHFAKVLGWHGPHLLNTLRALGCTPAERKSLDVAAEVKGKLGELRALRGAG